MRSSAASLAAFLSAFVCIGCAAERVGRDHGSPRASERPEVPASSPPEAIEQPVEGLPGDTPTFPAELEAIEIGAFPPPTDEEFEEAVRDGLWPPSGSSFPSNAGRFFLDVTVSPDPIPLNALFDLDVRLTHGARPGGTPVKLPVTADARMPQHRHGMNIHPRLEWLAPGHLRVRDMLLHMPGYWEISFDIETESGIERAQMAVFVD